MEHLDRLRLVAPRRGQGTIDDALGNGFLAVDHDGVHELGQNAIAELRIRVDFAFFCA
jgi:hypothetical protein